MHISIEAGSGNETSLLRHRSNAQFLISKNRLRYVLSKPDTMCGRFWPPL